jgi:hypothetical protein
VRPDGEPAPDAPLLGDASTATPAGAVAPPINLGKQKKHWIHSVGWGHVILGIVLVLIIL